MRFLPSFLFAYLFLASSLLFAQTITVDVNPERVEIGQVFTYTIDASVDNGDEIQIRRLPNFQNFTQLGSQSAPRMISVNGKVSRGLSIFIKLKAKKTGNLTIQSPVLYFGRRPLKGPTTKIKVYPKGKLPESNTKAKKYSGYFIDVKRSPKRDLYVGQQVNVSYTLYTEGVGNSGPQPPTEPELDEFWIEDLSVQNAGRSEMVRIKGKLLRKTALRSYALFPLKSGPLTIQPMEMELILGSMFRSKTIHIASEAIRLKVKPLPANAPSSFYEGNVGNWTLNAFTQTRSAKTGEPFVFTLSLKGRGQIGRVRLPDFDALAHATLIKGEESSKKETRQGIVQGTKSVEYSIIPEKKGTLTIPSFAFSFFDPAKGSYESVESQPIKILVRKGKQAELLNMEKNKAEPNKRGSTDDIVKELLAQMKPVDPTSGHSPSSDFPLYLFLLLSFPAFFGILWLFLGEKVKRVFDTFGESKQHEEMSALKAKIEHLTEVDDLKTIKGLLHKVLELPLGVSSIKLQKSLEEKIKKTDAEAIVHLFEEEKARRYNPNATQSLDLEKAKSLFQKILPHLLLVLSLFVMFGFSPNLHANEPAHRSALLKNEEQNTTNPNFYFEVSSKAIDAKNFGVARWALERATYLAPSFDDAQSNLSLMTQIVRIRSIEASKRGLTLDGNEGIFWWKFFGRMPSLFWGGFMVLFWWITFAFFFARYRSDSETKRDLFFTIAVLCGLIALLLSASLFLRTQIRAHVRPAVVIEENLILKEGPNAQANTIPTPRTVVPGVMLNVSQTRKDWSRIDFPNKEHAWIQGNKIWFVQKKSPNTL